MVRATWVVVIPLALAACSGSADAPAETTTTTNMVTTTSPPTYFGAPDSAFCVQVVEGADRPLLDPFEAGLEPREIELRLRALVIRFEQLAEAAPPELTDDVGAVAAGLATLDETLAVHDHDLGAAGAAGADLTFLDDSAFVDVAARIAAYTEQVCERT